MRLLHINYYAGKGRKDSVVLMLKCDDKSLIGLKSDKIFDTDIKKIRDNQAALSNMGYQEMVMWMRENLASYNSAFCEYKNGRYTILKEHNV